jgi:hypothetical protein
MNKILAILVATLFAGATFAADAPKAAASGAKASASAAKPAASAAAPAASAKK